MSGPHKPRHCPWCGVRISHDHPTCVPCRSIEIGVRKVPEASHALTGGRWVQDGYVLRWVVAS